MTRIGDNPNVGGTNPPGDTGNTGGVANTGRVGDSDFTVGRGGANSGDPNGLAGLFDANGNIDSANLDSMSFKLEGMSKSAGDIFSLMALIIQMSKEQREGARHVRDAQHIVQQQELQNAADEMRKAADMALAAAIVSGVFKMASAGVSIGGGIKGLKDLNTASDATSSLSKTSKGIGDVSESSTESMKQMEIVRNKGRIFDGTSQMTTATGDIIAAGLTHAASNHSANQKVAEANAQKAESFAQREQDFLRSLDETIAKVISLIQDIQQSNNESLKRAASV